MKIISKFKLMLAFGLSFALFSNDSCNNTNDNFNISDKTCETSLTTFEGTWISEKVSVYRGEDIISQNINGEYVDLELLAVERFISSEDDVMYVFSYSIINADNIIVGPLYEIKSCDGETEFIARSLGQKANYFSETFYGEEVELEVIID